VFGIRALGGGGLIMSSAIAEREACRYISRLIQERCGIQIHYTKEALIRSRLGRRMRQHGLATLPDYCDFLQHQEDEEELKRVVDALTTHFTHFLREPEHFQFLAETVLTERQNNTDVFHAWSAASSSGEESYTLALYFAEHAANHPGFHWQVCASDVSNQVLEMARLGIYEADRLEPLPKTWLRKYFQKGVGTWEGHFRVKREITDHVTFRQINLIEDYSHAHSFQVIFLRNVLMYLDSDTQQEIVKRVCRFLAPGGYLMTGHSEKLNSLDVPLRVVRPSVYQLTEG
jgi:chemotaxis protein methyltransferase CheR